MDGWMTMSGSPAAKGYMKTHVDGFHRACAKGRVDRADKAGHDDEQLGEARQVAVALVVVLVVPQPRPGVADGLRRSGTVCVLISNE